jgi:hypothetical protein
MNGSHYDEWLKTIYMRSVTRHQHTRDQSRDTNTPAISHATPTHPRSVTRHKRTHTSKNTAQHTLSANKRNTTCLRFHRYLTTFWTIYTRSHQVHHMAFHSLTPHIHSLLLPFTIRSQTSFVSLPKKHAHAHLNHHRSRHRFPTISVTRQMIRI